MLYWIPSVFKIKSNVSFSPTKWQRFTANTCFTCIVSMIKKKMFSVEHSTIRWIKFSCLFQISQRQKAQRTIERINGHRSPDARPVGTSSDRHRPTSGLGIAKGPRMSVGKHNERRRRDGNRRAAQQLIEKSSRKPHVERSGRRQIGAPENDSLT